VIRVVVLGVLALVLHAAVAALSVTFDSSGLPIAPAVVLVAYAALAEPPVEASISASVLGLLLDALTGAPLGLNMLACLAALGLGRPLAGSVSSPRSWSAFLFAAGLSAGYSIFIRVLLSVFAGESFGFQGVFTTALTSGLLALMVFPWLSAAMIRFGLEDREESLAEKLGRRARKPSRAGHES
jgi:rod shape-determining protein MreD